MFIFLSCPTYLQIVPLLAHPNEDISREALALMKALLFSGNEEVQEGLANSLKETREEILFLHLKQRIEIASHNYKERYVKHKHSQYSYSFYFFTNFEVLILKNNCPQDKKFNSDL